MQNKIFRLISVFVVLVILLCPMALAGDSNPTVEITAHALWSDEYGSYSDMGADADLIVLGTVDSQNPELRCDLVFTRSVIEIAKEFTGNSVSMNTIEIIQTGGSLGNIFTPEFEEAPILKNDGTEYLLFLEYVNDDNYGEYYLILGGGLGAIDSSVLTSTFEDNLSSCADITAHLDQVLDTGISPRASSVNTTGGYFYTKTPKVFYRSTVTSTMLTYVKSGILAWNNGSSTSGATVSTTTSASSADVTVSAGAYGSTGWAGYTWRYNSSGDEAQTVDRYASAYIGLNTSFLSSSSSNWKLVAMHEMGHVFGLAHTDNTSVSTVMRTSYSTLINTGLTAPTSADYSAVRTAYSYGGL